MRAAADDLRAQLAPELPAAERRVLDLTSANGTVLLGHGHPRVTGAVVDQVRNAGNMFPTTLSALRIDLAERLCARYPAGEKAVFFRTGSEATTAAVRLARAATGRRLVLSSGYHGWHDWHLGFQGVGLDAATDTVHFGYSVEALDRLLGLDVGPEPHMGSPTTVNVAHYAYRVAARDFPFTTTAGPSMRHVVDMGNLDGAGGFVIGTGQSGIPFSRHYDDQRPLWTRGALLPLPMAREAVAARARKTMILEPVREE